MNQTPSNEYARQHSWIEKENLIPLPEKPYSVVEFEAMNNTDREKVRNKPDYKEIEQYYKDYNDILHHNISLHYWKQYLGLEPEGLIEYYGNFISLIRKKIPTNEQYQIGPDSINHNPYCEYKLSNFNPKSKNQCFCGPKKKKEIFEKIKSLMNQD